MKILPAIDLLDGKCVRLIRGDYSQVTVYSNDPASMAAKWVAMGAEELHVVDLDGAREGKPVNRDAIRAIVETAGIPVEIGGGVRSVQTASDYLDLGSARVVLGTSAIETPDLVLAIADLFPDRVMVGIDVKDGKPATRGWLETVACDPVELAGKFSAMGASGIIYTDISRDGVLGGANIEGLKAFAEAVDLPVTASGGVTTLEDVAAVSALGQAGVTGMIIGKALYDGALNLDEAIRIADGEPGR